MSGMSAYFYSLGMLLAGAPERDSEAGVSPDVLVAGCVGEAKKNASLRRGRHAGTAPRRDTAHRSH